MICRKQEIICPDRLLEQARRVEPVRTAVIGADSSLALQSARLAQEAGIVEPVLIGSPGGIREKAAEIGWSVDSVAIEPAADEREAAARGARLAAEGRVGAIMKGHVHTDTLMAAIFGEKSLRTGRRMSHVFHLTVPHSERPLLITDAALNIAPDLETKKAIIANAVDLCHSLGMEEPKIAVLSASETPHPRMPSSMEAKALTEWAAESVPGASALGPVAFDNVVSREAALIKGIDHPVAGDADVVVVPSIECGNALFKMMVYFMGACAAGVVLGGRIPVMLTSRADDPAARLGSAALAVIAARGAESGHAGC